MSLTSKFFVLALASLSFHSNASASCYQMSKSEAYEASKGADSGQSAAVAGMIVGGFASIVIVPLTAPAAIGGALTTAAAVGVGATPGISTAAVKRIGEATAETYTNLLDDAVAGDGLTLRDLMETFEINAPVEKVAKTVLALDKADRYCPQSEIISANDIGKLTKLIAEKN